MWEERSLRVRDTLADLASTGVGVGALHAEAIRLVSAVVGSDLTCWASLDPETATINAMTSGPDRIPVQYEPILAETEYSPSERHRFAALAARGQDLALLSDLPPGERYGSDRFTRVWRPLGIDRELRFLFTADGVCWGGAGLVRTGTDFTDREVEFLRAVAPAIARATQLAVRAALPGTSAGSSPAIVVVDAGGQLRSLTPGALWWRERMEDTQPGTFLTLMRVMTAGLRSAPSGDFRARVRADAGHWALLSASPLLGVDEPLTAVVVEAASGQDLLGLVLAAHGLTPRERTLCEEVLSGRSTTEIAEHLYISTHTVQDHLKSIFAKFDVHSRGRLVAALQPHWVPRAQGSGLRDE